MIEFYLIKQSAYRNGCKRLQLLEDESLRRRFCRCMEGDKFLTIPYVLFCGRKLSANRTNVLRFEFGRFVLENEFQRCAKVMYIQFTDL